MSFLKKNLLFVVIVVLCTGAFLAGAYLLISESGKIEKGKRGLAAAETRLSSLLNADPAPTRDNLATAENNLEELSNELEAIRSNLQRGAALRTTSDPISVMAGIQQYISQFQRATAEKKDEAGEPAAIETPDDFGFGFKPYVKETTPPEDPTEAAVLDKQRQILSYLLTQLIAADPASIDVVEREVLETSIEGAKSLTVSDAITARVPGAIDTMAFSITFSGYTYALRDFLNTLAEFELPIVVRNIEVSRPSGRETVVAPAESSGAGGLADFFGVADSSEENAVPEGPKPVIEENISQFTIILEFIEIVLPDSTNQALTDSV
ncbi:MAG: hypothetical protein ACPGSB_08150 [Opitutales bacterium]